MKVQRILGIVCMMTLVIPMLASAEIYKWKDKNGVTRYSDSPPPGNVKADTIGRTGTAKSVRQKSPSNTVETPSKKVAPTGAAKNLPKEFERKKSPEEQAARARARNAENEKKKKLEKERQAKLNAENCKAAKSNYETYAQGGRIYKVDEDGERVYEDDASIAAGKKKAQSEIRKYCK